MPPRYCFCTPDSHLKASYIIDNQPKMANRIPLENLKIQPEIFILSLVINPIPMKTKLLAVLGLFFAIIVLSIACRKSTTPETEIDPPVELPKDSSEVPFPQTIIPPCDYAPSYHDTLICDNPLNGQDYIISPVNNPGNGKYLSWPIGMKIDSTTGAINVTKSESGLRYIIGFIKEGTTDTCLTELVLAGASYRDSVHVLSNGEKYANPYYNADPTIISACATGNCDFDITNEANNKKIAVDKKTGKIDLEKSLNQGAFGLLTLDGDMVETTIYYKLNDGCNTSVQHIKVQFMYFTRKSQINSGLLGTLLSRVTNLLNGNILSASANPRPPLIIITRFN